MTEQRATAAVDVDAGCVLEVVAAGLQEGPELTPIVVAYPWIDGSPAPVTFQASAGAPGFAFSQAISFAQP